MFQHNAPLLNRGVPNPVAKNLLYKTRPLAGGLSSNAMGLTTTIGLQLHKDWVTSTGDGQPKLKLPAKKPQRRTTALQEEWAPAHRLRRQPR
jgi:hypothetical protein